MKLPILTLDIETGINGGENPFADTQDIVAVGWGEPGTAEKTVYGPHETFSGLFSALLDDSEARILATFNGKFDVQHLIQFPEDYARWQKFVAGGGILWDCQLAQYLLDGMYPETHYLSLNEVSAMHGGEQKIDAVADLWAAGVNTRDIDKDLLLEYLERDVRNTRRIFEKQFVLARDRGQLKSLLLNFGALCCSIEMERNGMHIDLEKAEVLRETLAAEVTDLGRKLEEFVPADVKETFNWGSRYHKSALLFGGVVNVPGVEFKLKTPSPSGGAQYTMDPFHEDIAFASKTEKHYLLEDGSTMPCEQWKEGESPPRVLTKAGKNAGEPKTKTVTTDDLSKPKSRQCQSPVTLPGHITPLPEWASSPPGVFKVGSEVMEVLADSKIPFVATMVRHTAATKDLGTYFWVEDKDGVRKGMLTKVGEDGIIHHSINHVSVVTGRLSSSNPNLQNIPRKDKSVAKKMFRSRFREGVIGQSDFSSLEVYVQAMLTQAKALTAALKAGLDVHVLKLSLSALGEGKSYEELLALCKGPGATPEWKEKRTLSKEISFQDAYGAGDSKIAKTTGMPVEDVSAFREANARANPEIGEFFEHLAFVLSRDRVPHGPAVPHPEVPGVLCHLGRAVYVTPDGKRYGFTERPALRFQVEQGRNQGFSPTEIKNYVGQGTGGEIAKAAMWLCVREFYRYGNFGNRALLVNQVHDAVYIDAAKEVSSGALEVLHACMLAASPFFEKFFKWELGIYVPAETSFGEDLADEQSAAIPDVQDLVEAIVARYSGKTS